MTAFCRHRNHFCACFHTAVYIQLQRFGEYFLLLIQQRTLLLWESAYFGRNVQLSKRLALVQPTDDFFHFGNVCIVQTKKETGSFCGIHLWALFVHFSVLVVLVVCRFWKPCVYKCISHFGNTSGSLCALHH